MAEGGFNPGGGFCNRAVLVDGVCVCARALSHVHPPAPNPPPHNSPSPSDGKGREIEGRERKRERDALYSVATDALQAARCRNLHAEHPGAQKRQ
jgi:hypothetical protein